MLESSTFLCGSEPSYVVVVVSSFLGHVHTMAKSRGEESIFRTKLCQEEKPLGWKGVL